MLPEDEHALYPIRGRRTLRPSPLRYSLDLMPLLMPLHVRLVFSLTLLLARELISLLSPLFPLLYPLFPFLQQLFNGGCLGLSPLSFGGRRSLSFQLHDHTVSQVADLGRTEDVDSDVDTNEEYNLSPAWAHDDTNPSAPHHTDSYGVLPELYSKQTTQTATANATTYAALGSSVNELFK
eukprot:COSAG01_NODE_2683_length_7256_cov_28.923432_6_plen_180_part_00